MARTLTIKVPDRVHRAIKAKGDYYEMGPGDFLKQFVMASAMGAEISMGLKAVIDRQEEGQQLEEEETTLPGVELEASQEEDSDEQTPLTLEDD